MANVDINQFLNFSIDNNIYNIKYTIYTEYKTLVILDITVTI